MMETPGEDNDDDNLYLMIKSVCVTRRYPSGGFTMMMMMLLMMRVRMMSVMFLMIMVMMLRNSQAADKLC